MTTSLAISFRIEKATPEGRFVSGWLSVVQKDGKRVEDTQGDLISMDELRKGVHKYMAGSRVIKKQHSGDQIGEMVEIVMIDDDFAKAHGIKHTKRGAWGTAEITDEATRDDVRKGKVTGWSMGGRGKRTPIAKSGYEPLRELDEAVEKAAMRFAGGQIRRMSRRQKRNIRIQNATDKELRAGTRSLVAPQYRGASNTNRAPLGGGAPRGAKRPMEQRVFFRRGNSKLTSLRDKTSQGRFNRNRRLRSLRSFRGLLRERD